MVWIREEDCGGENLKFMKTKARFFDRIVDFIDRRQSRTIFILIIFLLLTFFAIPILVTKLNGFIVFDNKTANIANTITGVTSPLLALLVAFLAFLAFWVQYKANQQQKIDLKKERFENKFFEMLKLHKENVEEMNIEGYDSNESFQTPLFGGIISGNKLMKTTEQIQKFTSGRKIFVTTFTELRASYEICQTTLHFEDIPDKKRYLIKMAYKFLYNGVGSDIVTEVDSKIPMDKEYVKLCKEQLKNASKQHVDSHGKNNVYRMPSSSINVELYFKYKPFSGHASRFGHYYRHLYQMVKFVVSQDSDLFDYPEKREYLRIVRAQLSDNEQLMLYFNYLSGYGEAWENNENHFFSDYRMIHNLPVQLVDFTINPSEEFKMQIEKIRESGEEMFEADE